MGLSNLRLFQLLALGTTVLAAGCTRDTTAVPGASTSPAPAYRAVARGRVDVEGGQLPLTMPVEATLAEVRVREGDQVSRGQVLAVADASGVGLQQEMAQARLDAARRQEHDLQVRIATARKRAQRLVSAASAGAADGQGADDAGDATNQLIAERDAARGAEAVARSEIDQAKYLQARHVLRAPVDGEVVRVSAQAGMSVSPQSPALVTLLPHRPHFIRAELGESLVPAIHVGMTAQLVAEDDTEIAAGLARVTRIGSIFGAAAVEDDASAHIGERTVECDLAIEGKSQLRVGQRVLVRFLAGPAAASRP